VDECKPLQIGKAKLTAAATFDNDKRKRQGLTLVLLSAQPEPFLTQNTP